jgi:hypothetical protein
VNSVTPSRHPTPPRVAGPGCRTRSLSRVLRSVRHPGPATPRSRAHT